MFLNLIESIKIAVSALVENKTRTFLATLGIMTGIFTVTSMMSIVNGLNRAFSKQISSLGSNVLYISKYPWVMTSGIEKYQKRKNITYKNYLDFMKTIKKEYSVSPEVKRYLTVEYDGTLIGNTTTYGVGEEYFKIAPTGQPADGRAFVLSDIGKRKQVAVIGADIAEKLFPDRSPLGKRLKIGGQSFRITGVLEKKGKSFGINLDRNIYIPVTSLHKKFGKSGSIDILIKVEDRKQLEVAKTEITGIMRTIRKTGPEEENDFSINMRDMLTRLYKSITGGVYAGGIAVTLISLLAGGINIMNIMLVSIRERMKEIGIRKSLGAKESTITSQFLVEASLICCIGGWSGIIMSFAAKTAIEKYLPVALSFKTVILSLIFSILTGLFFGIFPARKASGMDPVEALRYE